MDHRYKKFLAVAETGSFSEAARLLKVSQPAITLSIGSLERAFGTKLYIRKKYSIELTQQGKIVAHTAKRIAAEVDKMRVELAKAVAIKQARLGVIDTIGRLVFSAQQTMLLTQLDIMVDNSQRIIAELLADNLDIGIITGQPKALGKDIETIALQGEVFVFVTAPYLSVAGPVTKISDWLATNKDSTTYKLFIDLFKQQGLKVKPVFSATSMEFLKEMAVAGKGTALLPLHMVKESVQNGTLEIVATKPIIRPIWAIYKKDFPPTDVLAIANQLNNLIHDANV